MTTQSTWQGVLYPTVWRVIFLGLLTMTPYVETKGGPLSGDPIATDDVSVIVHPINHATFLLGWKDKAIYVDPVGGLSRFQGLPRPDLVLITDIHGDHLDAETLAGLVSNKSPIVAPPAVAEMLPSALRAQTTVLTNGQSTSVLGLSIDAIPMYNLTPERQKYHPRGRGNGYILTIGGKRFYISGDTEDIPEMLALKDVAVTFLCMNLPYTMDVSQAARAVRAFRPKIVYPYHCRGSDLQDFKRQVGTDLGIDVRLRDWY
ncbi:MAG: MBL fold metallo-hydrolase [Candidatus Omnitrophica bacterium]|nr:MBL fold metallo-hydrolase [Candidatus Omnitrophota bacterium]